MREFSVVALPKCWSNVRKGKIFLSAGTYKNAQEQNEVAFELVRIRLPMDHKNREYHHCSGNTADYRMCTFLMLQSSGRNETNSCCGF